jgi:hypothetical protein
MTTLRLPIEQILILGSLWIPIFVILMIPVFLILLRIFEVALRPKLDVP